MKILFVENYDLNSDNPMSTLYPLRCNKIKDNLEFDICNIGSENVVDTNYETVLFGARSLYLYKTYKSKEKIIIKSKLDKLLCIKNKFFLIQDMHQKTYGNLEELCKLLNDNNINIIFTFYNNTEAKKIRNLTPNCKHLYLPLHIDNSIFNCQNLEKQYDILLYGSIHPRHYPFRKRLFDILLIKTNKYKICYIEKPDNFDPTKCEIGLAKLINQSKITIATKSRYDYFVAKYLEIAFCKSLVAGNMATDGLKIFDNNYLNLNEKMSDQDIYNAIDTCLQNYNIHENNIDNLHDKLINEYNIDNYVIKLITIIKSNI